jgi:enoyl-CoA hydratase
LPEAPHVLEEQEGRVLFLTLNRPEKLNPLSIAMQEELAAALETAGRDREVRVIVIRGAGRAFSAGHDVSPRGWNDTHVHESGPDPVAIVDFDDYQHELLLRVWDCPKPVICSVHGYCLAGSTIIPAVADITLVAEDAVIGFVKLPFGAGLVSPFWVHQVGLKRAKEMSYLPGSSIDGRTAVEWGWANHAYPASELEAETRALAFRMASVPGDLLKMKKRALNRMVETTGWRNAVMAGTESAAIVHFSPELKELSDEVTTYGWIETVRRFEARIADEIESRKQPPH